MSDDTSAATNTQENMGPNANGKARARGPRPTESLPTNRIATSKQFELLRAFGAVSGPDGKPVTNVEVSKVAGLHAATVGLAVPFFTSVGLLIKSNDGLIPAPEVRDFSGAFEWNPQRAFERTAAIFRDSWFYQRLLPKLRFQPLSRNVAIQELAIASNAAPDYRSQLDALIEYLSACGLIRAEGDNLRLGCPEEPEGDSAIGAAMARSTAEPTPKESPQSRLPGPSVATTFSGPTAGVIQFNISVKVDMAEFAGWSPDRISAFFSGVAQVLAAKGNVEERASSLADY